MRKRKTYTVSRPVEAAAGHQFWTVIATSPEEAIRLIKEGKGTFLCEEVEVTDIGEPEIVEESTDAGE